MNVLSLQSMIGRGAEHVETRIGDQTLMMSVDQGKYYSVDATAGRIWDLIEHPRSIKGIVDLLTEEYDVSAEDCEHQVKAFVGELIANGLAVEHEGASKA
jgi:hypothetical protein